MPEREEVSFYMLDRLTDELVESGLVAKDQMAVAKMTQKNLGGDIGHILIKKGFVTEEQLLEFLSTKLRIPFVSLKEYSIDPTVTKLVPISIAQKYHFMPLYRIGETLTIAMADPMDVFARDEIKAAVKLDIQPVLASKEEIQENIKIYYRLYEPSISISEEGIEVVRYEEELSAEETGYLQEVASGAKIVEAVNSLIWKAYNEHSSDVHIEPSSDTVRVRYRIDGLLEERNLLSKSMHLPIVSRLKIMAGMDIAERRIPQDGRIRLKMMGNELDLRLSTYPTMHGEKVVIRLLPKEGLITLEVLGLSEEDKARFAELIKKPYGMILVTGPTGCGKTTTLYAALQYVNSQDKNIVSIEDPIENEIPSVSQAQVNVKAGVTFASALRSILRQDPDIIMVGEIRDKETASIAVRSAITGHLIFSTLHTNTALGAVARLEDLGVEPFLISSSLLGLMSQRLVRRICPDCKYEIKPTPELLKGLGLIDRKKFEGPLYRGKGCKKCRMSGYQGRVGIFELVVINEKMRMMIAGNATEEELKKEARTMGVKDIREDGVSKVITGTTTIEELIRATQEE